jgi:hypothetical protein
LRRCGRGATTMLMADSLNTQALKNSGKRTVSRGAPHRSILEFLNSKSMKRFLIWLFLLFLSGPAFASDWKREVNERWGFALTYPGSLIPEPLPANGDGRRYHSADHEVSLAAMGSHTHPDLLGESLDGFWQKELADRGDTVTYKFKKRDFYVISGVNPNGYEYYHKVFFYPTYWVEFEITYPHSKHQRYDVWVERISHVFIPALPDNGQYDR